MAAATGLAGTGRHTVRPGETLSDIAAMHGTTVSAIAQANGIRNTNLIVAGDTLTIPDAAGAAPSGGAQSGTYVVRAGDTLATIAAKYGTTAQAIAQASGIKNVNLIIAGQTLTIPGAGGSSTPVPAVSGGAATGSYTVKAGDTLATIAAKFGITVPAIAQANGIANPNLIVIGRTLAIPGAGGTGGGSGGQPAGPVEGTVPILRGDNISLVSARTGVPVETLIAANGLPSPYNLYYGGYLFTSVQNPNPAQPLAACPVPGARFMNDWGFGRSDTGVHRGNDLFKPKGTPILAVVSGTATQGVGAIGGNFVRLAGDDGTSYYFAHMSQFGAAGRVNAGDVIGYIGNTGDAAGGPTHLHFEIHPAGGAAVNPYQALVAACR